MIRAAAFLTALTLAGCGTRSAGPVVNDTTIGRAPEIFAFLPDNLTSDLRAADSRFRGLSNGQIDQLMFSVLQTIGCSISDNAAVRDAQFSVMGFSAYRSVQLDLDLFEAWSDETDENAALWTAQKNTVGRALQQRAGRSVNESALLSEGEDGLVTALTRCEGTNGL